MKREHELSNDELILALVAVAAVMWGVAHPQQVGATLRRYAQQNLPGPLAEALGFGPHFDRLRLVMLLGGVLLLVIAAAWPAMVRWGRREPRTPAAA